MLKVLLIQMAGVDTQDLLMLVTANISELIMGNMNFQRKMAYILMELRVFGVLLKED